MIAEIIFLLTVGSAALAGIATAFICICIKISEFLIFPVIDFVLHLFGM